MSQTIELMNKNLMLASEPGALKRTAVLIYGIGSYAIGVTGLLWIILAMGGLAPVGFSPWKTDSIALAVLTNIALVIAFGLQHSVMARSRFKSWLASLVPQAMERSTFVLMSGVAMIAAIYFWQPLPGTAWSVENPIAKFVLWSAYAAGWAYLLIATFVTNHFELMGLRQVYLYFTNQPYTVLPFTRKYMYRYSRHPMMLGVLVGIWAVPVMSISHLVMSSFLSLYIVVGIMLEERDLVHQFGETYRKYRKEIPTLFPGI